jgi:chromosome segregation ATPase
MLEDKSRLLEEKLAKAREESAPAPESPSVREATTAAEIDNETLTAQLKHLQQKLSNLEEELEETRAQAEADAESWKNRLTKAKDGERAVLDREREIKEEVKRLQKAADGAKSRIAELEGALKENNGALEGARAEIESLRGEAAVRKRQS